MNELKDILIAFAEHVVLSSPHSYISDMVDKYLPLIKATADKEAYIDEAKAGMMADYPKDGSTMQEKVDYFASLKENKILIESHLNAINDAIKEIQAELVAWMDTNPVRNLQSTDGKLLTKSTRTYGKILNLHAFKIAMGSEWEKYEGVNTKALNALIKELKASADKNGIDLERIIPNGVEVSYNSYLSMRNATTNGGKANKSADEVTEFLMELITDGGEE